MTARIEVEESPWTFGTPVFGDTPQKKLVLAVAAAGLAVILIVLANSGWNRLQVDRHYRQAVDLHESNDTRAAGEAYKRVLSIDPDHMDANIGLGLLEVRKHPLRAIARYKKAIVSDPGHPAAYAGLAYAYFGRPGKSSEAIEQMRKAARLDPRNYQYPLALGIFLSKTGRTGEAIDALEEVVRLSPTALVAHEKLVDLYTQRGDKGKARLHRAMMTPVKPL